MLFLMDWHSKVLTTASRVTDKYANPYIGWYLLLWDKADLRKAYALTSAFSSCIVIIMSLLRSLSTEVVWFILGFVYYKAF